MAMTPFYDHTPARPVGTLVCLPGVNSGAYLFEEAVAALGENWRVIRINVPGVEGVPLPVPFSTTTYAQHAWKLLDGLKVQGRLVVLGHSMGGFAAQEFVKMRPEQVERAVLVSTSRGQPDTTVDLSKMQRALGKSFWQFGKEVDEDAFSAMQPLFGPDFLARHMAIYANFIDQREAYLPGPTARLAHLSAGGMFSSVRWVKKLTLPVLVVHGTHDILVRPEAGKKLAEALPNGRWLELYGVGHFPMLEHSAFWQRVAEFINGGQAGREAPEKEHPLWQWAKDFFFRHG